MSGIVESATTEEQKQGDTMALHEKLRAYLPWLFAIMILSGYAWFIYYLIGKTDSKDEEWVKITYIFSSVEAIVFTAVGFIFGREVNKSRAVEAERKEEQAKKDKKEFAKEVLDKIPQAPTTPDLPDQASLDINSIRAKAEIYLYN